MKPTGLEVRIFLDVENDTVLIQIVDHDAESIKAARMPKKSFIVMIDPILNKPAPNGVTLH